MISLGPINITEDELKVRLAAHGYKLSKKQERQMTHDPNLRKDLETLREEVDGLTLKSTMSQRINNSQCGVNNSQVQINQMTNISLQLITARLAAIEEALKLK